MKYGIKSPTAIGIFLHFMKNDAVTKRKERLHGERLTEFMKMTARRYPNFNYEPTRIVKGKKIWSGL